MRWTKLSVIPSERFMAYFIEAQLVFRRQLNEAGRRVFYVSE